MEFAKEKNPAFFVLFILNEAIFFNICFISMYSALNTLSEHTYLYILTKQALLHKLFSFLKSSKAFNVSLIPPCIKQKQLRGVQQKICFNKFLKIHSKTLFKEIYRLQTCNFIKKDFSAVLLLWILRFFFFRSAFQ